MGRQWVQRIYNAINNQIEENYQKEIEKRFREQSDQEIERAYRNRYDKTEWQQEVIEDEAHRRGIY